MAVIPQSKAAAALVLILVLVAKFVLHEASEVSADYYCGYDWPDAARNCHRHCPSGEDHECETGMRCYAATKCHNPTVSISSDMRISLNGAMNDLMSGKDIALFEQVLREFLKTNLASAAVNTNKVKITGQELRSLTTRSHPCSEGGRCHERQMQTSSSALDVVVIITGEYRPPPFQNLDALVEDSLNVEGPVFVEELKAAPSETYYFDQVDTVDAVAVASLTLNPSRSPTASPSEFPSPRQSQEPTSVPQPQQPQLLNPQPHLQQSLIPSNLPSFLPSNSPSSFPSGLPSLLPSELGERPSTTPTNKPSFYPSNMPSFPPSSEPSTTPSSRSPSTQPSNAPTAMPSRAKVQSLSAYTQFGDPEYTTGSYGLLFNLRTTLDGPSVLILSIDFYTDLFTEVGYEVWTKEGTYHGHRGDFYAWQNVASGTVKGMGVDAYTSIPFDKFKSVPIKGGGKTQAFLVTLHSIDILYQIGDGLLSDELIQMSNSELQLFEGEGVIKYPWTTDMDDYRSPRKFLGTIWYDRSPCDPFSQEYPCPTKSPVASTALPSGAPSSSAVPSQSPFASPSSKPSETPSVSSLPSANLSASLSSSLKPSREYETTTSTGTPTQVPTKSSLAETQGTPTKEAPTQTPSKISSAPSNQITAPSSNPTNVDPHTATTNGINQPSVEPVQSSTDIPSASRSDETEANPLNPFDTSSENEANSSGIIIGMAVGAGSLLALTVVTVAIIARGNWNKKHCEESKKTIEGPVLLSTLNGQQQQDKHEDETMYNLPVVIPKEGRTSEKRPFRNEIVDELGGEQNDNESCSRDIYSESASTLLSRNEAPETFIGRRLSVRFSGDKYYSGVIKTYNHFTKQHRVMFDDGDVKDYDLRKKTMIWEHPQDESSVGFSMKEVERRSNLSAEPLADDISRKRALMMHVMQDQTLTMQERHEALKVIAGASDREIMFAGRAA